SPVEQPQETAPAISPTSVAATVPAAPPAPPATPVTLRPLTATQQPVAAGTTPASVVAAEKMEPSPPVSPQSALESVRTAVRLYGSMFGGNPVGTNAEITRALLGANPKNARLLEGYRL